MRVVHHHSFYFFVTCFQARCNWLNSYFPFDCFRAFMGSWNRKVVEILIYLYKKHPILYDCRADGYSNKKERHAVLTAIARELSKRRPTTVYEIKKKIKTLRSQYSAEKALLKKKNKVGSYSIYQPKLWCFEYLRFLDKHINRKRHVLETSLPKEPVIKVEPSLNVEADFSLSDESDIDAAFTSLVKSNATILRLEKIKSRDEDFNKPIVKREPTEISTSDDKHDIFGKYIASELRELTDERLLFETKVAIQGIINDAKIRLLDNQEVETYNISWMQNNEQW